MADKGTTQNLGAWLVDEFSAPGWHSAVVAQELSEDLLDNIVAQFDEYDKATKIGILFSILHIRKGDMVSKMNQVTKIIGIASQDQDEWVRLLGHTIQDVPALKQLNLNSNEWSSQAQPTLDHIVETVRRKGFGFHPIEFSVVQKSARPVCNYTNPCYDSNEPTIIKHFQLDTTKGNTISDTERSSRFEALVQAEDETLALESPLTSPTSYSNASNRFPGDGHISNSGMSNPMAPASASGIGRPPPPASSLYARGSMDGRSGIRPPPPRPRPNASASSSLFIQRPMSRKPSLGSDANKPSFLRPSGPARFNRPLPPGMATNASGGGPSLHTPGSNLPSRPPMARNESSIPKGFIKQSRVQMLDFSDASVLQESNTRAIDTAMQDLQNEKEAKKLQLAEERRLASEKRKLEAQKEKEEREATKRRKHSKADTAATTGNDDATEGPVDEQTIAFTEQHQSSPDGSPTQQTQPVEPPQPMEPNSSYSQFYANPDDEYLPPQN
ncbi:unnamed protein product [Absidia cylindrospora]